MRTKKPSSLVAYTILVVSLFAAGTVAVITQQRESPRPDLTGRWQLNRELSENAEAKLEAMHSSQGGGHRPPAGMHGLSGLFGGGKDEAEQARDMFLHRPTAFVVNQDGDRIELTDSDGRVRVLTANERKEKVNGRDVRTKWDKGSLVSEISLANAKVIETYERVATAPQLIVTTKMEMGGRDVSVRRVYDAESPR
jgi:hypothetical protein